MVTPFPDIVILVDTKSEHSSWRNRLHVCIFWEGWFSPVRSRWWVCSTDHVVVSTKRKCFLYVRVAYLLSQDPEIIIQVISPAFSGLPALLHRYFVWGCYLSLFDQHLLFDRAVEFAAWGVNSAFISHNYDEISTSGDIHDLFILAQRVNVSNFMEPFNIGINVNRASNKLLAPSVNEKFVLLRQKKAEVLSCGSF